MRRARMNAVFLYALVRRCGDLCRDSPSALLAYWRELATLAANAGVVSMVAASRTAAIFLFIVVLPSGHWLIGTGRHDHATSCTPLDVKGGLSAAVRCHSSR